MPNLSSICFRYFAAPDRFASGSKRLATPNSLAVVGERWLPRLKREKELDCHHPDRPSNQIQWDANLDEVAIAVAAHPIDKHVGLVAEGCCKCRAGGNHHSHQKWARTHFESFRKGHSDRCKQHGDGCV